MIQYQKDLLEKYLGIQLGQGASLDLDRFAQTHAQLFALAPNDRLYAMFKSTAKDDISAIQNWAGALEDAIASINDPDRLIKIQMTLADCYQNLIKDADKTADTYANLLRQSPDNIAFFRNCFDCYESLERYYDCTELCRQFSMDAFPPDELLKYTSKAIEFGFMYGYDSNTISGIIDIVVKNNEAKMPEIIGQLLQKCDSASVDSEQILGYMEQFENEKTGLTALSFKLAHAQMLIKLGRKADAVQLLGRNTKDEANKLGVIQNARAVASQLEGSSEYDEISAIWSSAPATPAPSAKSALPPTPALSAGGPRKSGPQSKIQRPVPQSAAANTASATAADADAIAKTSEALIKLCKDAPDVDHSAEIAAELQKHPSDDASAICVRIAAAFESVQNLPEAENYYKKAFSYNYSSELIEFYKRYRQFKKAIKVLNFKLAKASDNARTPFLLDLALSYEQLRKYPEAIQALDDILKSDKSIDKSTKLAILKQKAAYQLASGAAPDAVATLKQASAEADFKSREEIDIDTCLLMREFAPDEAKKLHSKLLLRGAKSEKMQLLTLSFDIDAQKFNEANNRLNNLLSASDSAIVISALEQKIRLQKAREDNPDDIRNTANELLALSPENAVAKAVLNT